MSLTATIALVRRPDGNPAQPGKRKRSLQPRCRSKAVPDSSEYAGKLCSSLFRHWQVESSWSARRTLDLHRGQNRADMRKGRKLKRLYVLPRAL